MNASLFTLDFTDERSTQVRLVGGKGAGLATMTRQGLPVAPGFTISTAAYRAYLEATGLDRRLAERLRAAEGLPIDALDSQAQTIAGWFDDTELPAPLFVELPSWLKVVLPSPLPTVIDSTWPPSAPKPTSTPAPPPTSPSVTRLPLTTFTVEVRVADS